MARPSRTLSMTFHIALQRSQHRIERPALSLSLCVYNIHMCKQNGGNRRHTDLFPTGSTPGEGTGARKTYSRGEFPHARVKRVVMVSHQVYM